MYLVGDSAPDRSGEPPIDAQASAHGSDDRLLVVFGAVASLGLSEEARARLPVIDFAADVPFDADLVDERLARHGVDRTHVIAAGSGVRAAAAIRHAFALGYGAVLASVPVAGADADADADGVAGEEPALALGWLEGDVLTAVERSSHRPQVRLLCSPEDPRLATEVRPLTRLLEQIGVAYRLDAGAAVTPWVAEQLGDAALRSAAIGSPRLVAIPLAPPADPAPDVDRLREDLAASIAAQRAADQLAAEADIRVVAMATVVTSQRDRLADLEAELVAARKATAVRAARAAADLAEFEQQLDRAQHEIDRQHAMVRDREGRLAALRSQMHDLEDERSDLRRELSDIKRKRRALKERCDRYERLMASRSYRLVHRLWAIRAKSRSLVGLSPRSGPTGD